MEKIIVKSNADVTAEAKLKAKAKKEFDEARICPSCAGKGEHKLSWCLGEKYVHDGDYDGYEFFKFQCPTCKVVWKVRYSDVPTFAQAAKKGLTTGFNREA